MNNVLAGHLYERGYHSVSARLLGNARQRDKRGGIRAWPSVRRDILNHLREDTDCLTTTMVDYYGLPQHGDGAWPGREAAGGLPFPEKASAVEDALLEDIRSQLGTYPDRFIPFVMMHEFEGLLFSDPECFAVGIGRPDLAPKLRAVRNEFATPEEINDSPYTAPSKRVEALVLGYQKPLLGLSAALEIGLAVIRAECPHFREWLDRLERSVA